MPPVASNAEESIILGPGGNDNGVAGVHGYGRFDLLAFCGVVACSYVTVGACDGLCMGGDG